MSQQIEKIKMLVQAMTGASEKQAAIEEMNAMLDTTQKNVNLITPGTPGAGAGPAKENRQGSPAK